VTICRLQQNICGTLVGEPDIPTTNYLNLPYQLDVIQMIRAVIDGVVLSDMFLSFGDVLDIQCRMLKSVEFT